MQKNDDGSYTVHMKKGDKIDAELEDGTSVSASMSDQAGDCETDFSVVPDDATGTFSIADGSAGTDSKD